MRSHKLLTQIRSRQATRQRARFATLNGRDLTLSGCSQPAASILQSCFGCDAEDAKAAWNDYVLRYVDGPQL